MKTPKLRSFARLVVGSVILVYEGLIDHFDEWEERSKATQMDTLASREITGVIIDQSPRENSSFSDILVGLAVDVEERLDHNLKKIDRLTRAVGDFSADMAEPLARSRIASPFVSRFNRLVDRGQTEIDRWRELGNREKYESKALTQFVVMDRVETTVDFMTTNPEVRSLVQSQSVSLAGEVVEEVRERAVSADNFLESLARGMFRRPPREELPEPPEVIKSAAVPIRRLEDRTVKK